MLGNRRNWRFTHIHAAIDLWLVVPAGALERTWKFDLPLALVELGLPDEAALIDWDDPEVLRENNLRPSQVATRIRETTQAEAQKLFNKHTEAAGIRWWSTLEASWINVSIFDRAIESLTLGDEVVLDTGNAFVRELADYLGLTLSAS